METTPPTTVAPERELQRDPNGPLAGARRAAELTEETPLSRARKLDTK